MSSAARRAGRRLQAPERLEPRLPYAVFTATGSPVVERSETPYARVRWDIEVPEFGASDPCGWAICGSPDVNPSEPPFGKVLDANVNFSGTGIQSLDLQSPSGIDWLGALYEPAGDGPAVPVAGTFVNTVFDTDSDQYLWESSEPYTGNIYPNQSRYEGGPSAGTWSLFAFGDETSQPNLTAWSVDLQLDLQSGIDRWYGSVGEQFPVRWNLELPVGGGGDYSLQLQGLEHWRMTNSPTVRVNGREPVSLNRLWDGTYESPSIRLDGGTNSLEFSSFQAPAEAAVDLVRFSLNVANVTPQLELQHLSTRFIADHPEPPPQSYAVRADADSPALMLPDAAAVAEYFVPALGFNGPVQRLAPESDIAREQVFPVRIWTSLYADHLAPNPEERTFGSGSADDFLDLERSYAGTYSVYAAVLPGEHNGVEELAVSYFFHYGKSNWLDHGGWNNHEGDWEGVTLFLRRSGDAWVPDRMAFAQHIQIAGGHLPTDEDAGVQVVRWEELDRDGPHANVYVGLGGHASYPFPGITAWHPYLQERLEYHCGDAGLSTTPAVEIIPRAGTAATDLDDWRLYPGRWGVDEDSPLGPYFLTSGFDPGERWLNPWSWADVPFSSRPQPSNDPRMICGGIIANVLPHESLIALGDKVNLQVELRDAGGPLQNATVIADVMRTSPAPPQFTRVYLVDDGAHDDGDAGDGIYGVTFPPASVGEYTLNVYADGERSDGDSFARSLETALTVAEFAGEDLNLDGATDPQDIAFAVYYLALYHPGPTDRLPAEHRRADVNHDGLFDAQDVLQTIHAYRAGNGGEGESAAPLVVTSLVKKPADIAEQDFLSKTDADEVPAGRLWAFLGDRRRKHGGATP